MLREEECNTQRKAEDRRGMLASGHEMAVIILNSQAPLVNLHWFSPKSGLSTTFHHDLGTGSEGSAPF